MIVFEIEQGVGEREFYRERNNIIIYFIIRI